jgi:hypothetical protein
MIPLTCWHVRNPSMPVFDIDGLRGRRKRRIREGAYGNPHHFGFTTGLPVHSRPAMGAEVEGDGISAIRLSSVGRGIAGHPDVFAWVERGDPVGRSSRPISWACLVFGRAAGTLVSNDGSDVTRLPSDDPLVSSTVTDRASAAGALSFVRSLLSSAAAGAAGRFADILGDPWRPLRRGVIMGLPPAARSTVCFLAIDLSIASLPRGSRCLHHRKPSIRARRSGGTGGGPLTRTAMLADAKKSSRKYDGAYFFIESHGMGESGPQISTVGRLLRRLASIHQLVDDRRQRD